VIGMVMGVTENEKTQQALLLLLLLLLLLCDVKLVA
jgi:hypothetical protein